MGEAPPRSFAGEQGFTTYKLERMGQMDGVGNRPWFLRSRGQVCRKEAHENQAVRGAGRAAVRAPKLVRAGCLG